ncbi:MAG: hypothetical protein CVV64_04790 [Candidatus Wallbacteria bacterium HGW-Wallbacteria-1]|uniref:Uncharacterized protein n=1 Tax=Candidatus Wallbacteria bacterium HGW-Wallbacteria-1 TaxID=2013854 RepID=A0A2N1PRY0_9BACT|nr:MAG: hypothetical protein CVV64_04790 [Candidatus Wallbacteria bacterium HGW-Wallbacteria-1]
MKKKSENIMNPIKIAILSLISLFLSFLIAFWAGRKKRALSRLNLALFPVSSSRHFENLKHRGCNDNFFCLSHEVCELQNIPISDSDRELLCREFKTLFSLIPEKTNCILIGEKHNHRKLCNLRNNLFMALNSSSGKICSKSDRSSYWPNLIMELPYSLTPAANHFTNIPINEDAEKFWISHLDRTVSMEEDREILELIRTWNLKHENHKLKILFSDIEHDFRATLEKIVFPKLEKWLRPKLCPGIDPETYPESMDDWTFDDLNRISPLLRQTLAEARAEKGSELEFIWEPPLFLDTVIDNLESTALAYEYNFTYYRQKAIIRNIMEINFLGQFINCQPTVISCGSDHSKTELNLKHGGNFLFEGLFLENENFWTKEKTYSIRLHCCGTSPGGSTNTPDSQKVGKYYLQWWNRLNDLVSSGVISHGDAVVPVPVDPIKLKALCLSFDNEMKPIVLSGTSIPEIDESRIGITEKIILKPWTARKLLQKSIRNHSLHNLHIFVPFSEITRHRSDIQGGQ